MSRRSTPERLDVARRDALRNRLTGIGMIETTADGWIAAWEAQTARDGLEGGAAYWQAAWTWIDTQRRRRAHQATGGRSPLADRATRALR